MRNGTYVGIVDFDDKATIAANMTLVRGLDLREALLAAVPSTADGGTSIGAGLQQCQQVSQSS